MRAGRTTLINSGIAGFNGKIYEKAHVARRPRDMAICDRRDVWGLCILELAWGWTYFVI